MTRPRTDGFASLHCCHNCSLFVFFRPHFCPPPPLHGPPSGCYHSSPAAPKQGRSSGADVPGPSQGLEGPSLLVEWLSLLAALPDRTDGERKEKAWTEQREPSRERSEGTDGGEKSLGGWGGVFETSGMAVVGSCRNKNSF